jgi:flagellar protein FlgJ
MDISINNAVTAGQVKRAGEKAESAVLKKACCDFEALFVGYMLQKMRQSVPQNQMFSGGRGEEIFRDLQDAAIAQNISAENGIGLSRMLYAELTKLAVKQAPSSP